MGIQFKFLHAKPTQPKPEPQPGYFLTLPILQKMWPQGNSKVPGLLEGIAKHAPTVFPKYGLNDKLTVAHAMAQFSEECDAGREMVENMNYSAERLRQVWPTRFGNNASDADYIAHQPQKIADTVYNGRMGNRVNSDDGWNYRGRGFSQLTGADNYHELSKRSGLDLVNHPEYLSDPEYALECGVADFVMCGCLPFAQKDDLMGVSAMLNVGHLVSDPHKINGYNLRWTWLSRWKQALNLTSEPDTKKMSKLSELAGSVAAVKADIEKTAEKAHDRIFAARDKAKAGISKIDGVAAEIEKHASEIEDFTNQITNGGPPLD